MIVASTVYGGDNRVGLTLIPPGTITNKVDLDILCKYNESRNRTTRLLKFLFT